MAHLVSQHYNAVSFQSQYEEGKLCNASFLCICLFFKGSTHCLPLAYRHLAEFRWCQLVLNQWQKSIPQRHWLYTLCWGKGKANKWIYEDWKCSDCCNNMMDMLSSFFLTRFEQIHLLLPCKIWFLRQAGKVRPAPVAPRPSPCELKM